MRYRDMKGLSWTQKSISLLLVLTLLCSVFPYGAHAQATDNIALGKEVTALSTKEGSSTDFVNDNDTTTVWESGNDWYKWVDIDLKATYAVDSVTVYVPAGTTADFYVYATADNENYKKVASALNNPVATADGYSVSIANEHATGVRILIAYNSASNTAQISEVQITGTYLSDTYPTPAPITTTDFQDTQWYTRYQNRLNDPAQMEKEVLAEASALVERILGKGYRDQFAFVLLDNTGKDRFKVEYLNGKITISGSNGLSLASGFNWYLKNVAHLNYDPLNVSNLKAPQVLPVDFEKVVRETPYSYKYLFNFCTYSYTMAFWGWEEYEAFLDWCAMNGVNLMLDVLGQEEVQRRMLNRFGYTDDEVKQYLTGPGYYAWLYMANMESFGGPLPNAWFAQRVELARKVHDRMMVYGIRPVFLGYAGQVLTGFEEKNPAAQVIPQGGWSGFSRPTMLKTYVAQGEDYFQRVSDVYYSELHKVFGDITDFYAVDPFHEGGRPGDLNITQIAAVVQAKMKQHDPNAKWVVQNWQANPTNAFLQGVSKEDTIVLDLYTDNQPNHTNRNEFNGGAGEGTPWIWNMLHSFGGRMGFSGMPEILAAIPEDLAASQKMAGIGVTAESLGTNPMLYEMLYDMGWEVNTVNVQDYISDYFLSRYGVRSENIEKAWEVMRDTAYFKRRNRQRAEDSIINARPGFGVTKACIYYTAEIDYDKKQFEQILDYYLKEYDNLKNNEAYLYDLADITRQVLANASYEYYRAFEDAWLAGDYETFKAMSEKFLDIIDLQDRVLSTQEEFLVGKWIDRARNLVADADDWTKDLFEFNARAQITTWGGRNGSNPGGLHDYSNRQWNGLTGTLYKTRWMTWINLLEDAALNHNWQRPSMTANAWFDMEYRWACKNGNEFAVTASDENLQLLAETARNQYSVSKVLRSDALQNKENLALNMPVTTNGKNVRPASNAVDGDQKTLWVNSEYPAEITVDLKGIQDVDGVDVFFERPAEDMSNPVVFAYKIEVQDENGKWIVLEDESANIEVKYYIVKAAYEGKAQKIRVTIPTADLELRPLVKPGLAEIYVWKAAKPEISFENVNYALEGTATASRCAPNPARHAASVIDGKIGTFWAAGTPDLPQWVEVDLNSAKNIQEVMIGFEKVANDFKYKVEIMDTNRTVLKTIEQYGDEKKPQTNTFAAPLNGVRYVRVTITGLVPNATAWPGCAEIQVIGGMENAFRNPQIKLQAADSAQTLKNLLDGDLKTCWKPGENKEILVDLGENTRLTAMSILSANALSYEIYQSKDGTSYTLALSGNQAENARETIDLAAIDSRYLKICFTNPEAIEIQELIGTKRDLSGLVTACLAKYEGKIKKTEVGIYSGQYLQADYDAVMAQMNAYRQQDYTNATLEQCLQANEAIFDAYTDYIRKSIVVDKNALMVAIDDARSLPESPELQEQIAAASTVYNTFAVTQEQVDAAVLALRGAMTSFKIDGVNMTLGNELSMNFMVKKSDVTELTGLSLQITKAFADGREPVVVTVPAGSWKDYSKEYYAVKFTDISAKEMTDQITAVILKDGKPAGDVYTESVEDYALRILRGEQATAQLKVVIVDMLNYGAEAQKYFKYNENVLANAQLTDAEKALASAPIEAPNVQVKGDRYFGSNLNLGNSMTMTVYFKGITPDMHAVVSYTKHTGEKKEISVNGAEFVRYNDTVYGVRANTLVVADAQQPVTVTVYDADNQVVASGVDSIASYVARSTTVGELGQAILKLASSAETYFANR